MNVDELPMGSAPEALPVPHFPAPYLAVIWRNWNLVTPGRIARVLQTTVDKVEQAAASMGLVQDHRYLTMFKERGYLTVIRANWHLLDYPQLLELLDWTPERLAFVMQEDDFFWNKLGMLKPRCGTVRYRELSEQETATVADIAKLGRSVMGRIPSGEPPFSFLRRYGNLSKRMVIPPDEGLRMLYSYSAVYGDPLLDDKSDPYPEALLRDYAASGVNAVWIPGVLHLLVPWLGNIPISENWELRIAGLRKLAQRTLRYGIKLFLYLNEPRALPDEIMQQLPWGGAAIVGTGNRAFCPHRDGMLETLSNGIEQLCRQVPELGGIITITMSENLTHCMSKPVEWIKSQCPYCSGNIPSDNVIKVLSAIHAGVKRSGNDIRLIAWNWGWEPEWDEAVLLALPPEIDIMCVSETHVETDCLGHKGIVRDYSISKVGPGPVAVRLWRLARKYGHRVIAKIQVNTTWEMAGVPIIPVPFLVEEHLNNLRRLGIDDFMLSWTVGGAPGGNLELLYASVEELARRDYNDEAQIVLKILKGFSEAFRKLPFDNSAQIYTSPQNIGPANLLYETPTGYQATMVRGFPYDDLNTWRWHYPEEVLEAGFESVSLAWQTALADLKALIQTFKGQALESLGELWIRSEAAFCFLRSTALQIKFIRLRNAGRLAETGDILREEMALAERLAFVGALNSGIGFEAANHYLYTQNDLLEKILNCQSILNNISKYGITAEVENA